MARPGRAGPSRRGCGRHARSALGGAYFGGLWWTLARLPRWRRPGWALAVSFAAAGPLLLVAFALLARQGVAPLLAPRFRRALSWRAAPVAGALRGPARDPRRAAEAP